MDKCNKKSILTSVDLVEFPAILSICSKEYKRRTHNILDGIKSYDYDNRDNEHFIFWINRKVLINVPRDRFGRQIHAVDKSQHLSYHIVTHKDIKILMLIESSFEPQFLGNLLSSLGDFRGVLSALTSQITMVSNTFKKCISKECILLILDVTRMLLDIRDGYFTLTKILTTILSFYNIHQRGMSLFKPQSLGLEDLASMFLMVGLPTDICNQLKTFTMLSGKKLFDNDYVMPWFAKLINIVGGVMDWFVESISDYIPKSLADMMRSVMSCLTHNLLNYNKIREVAGVYTQYVRNQQIIFDPAFRERCMKLHKECIDLPHFMEYVTNVNNKYFKTTWDLFRDTVVKSISHFDSSSREEPLCFVFEGLAGSGKSAFMNSVVDLLRKDGMSVYCHTVPATEDAKDFYDDYENQDVFVMDDVGQQGKSQWRTIINFVSPVKCPLPCAAANKKNTKFFNSKVIICTTNHFRDLNGFTAADCITEPEALFRRVHLVRVSRDIEQPGFVQRFQYSKFDHQVTHTWVDDFIHYNATANIPSSLVNDNQGVRTSLLWFYRIFKHLLRKAEENRQLLQTDADMLADVIRITDMRAENDDFQDAYQAQSWYDLSQFFSSMSWNTLHQGKALFEEWMQHCTTYIMSAFNTCTTYAAELISNVTGYQTASGDFWKQVLTKLIVSSSLITIVSLLANLLYGSGRVKNQVDDIRALAQRYKASGKFLPQAGEIHANSVIETLRKHARLVVVKRDTQDRNRDVITNAIVSGTHILLPAHLGAHDHYIDIYRSDEHLHNGHKEQENVLIKTVVSYHTCDIAVYKFVDTIPLYKKCRSIFNYDALPIHSTIMYMVNSFGVVPVVYGGDVHNNADHVSYTAYALSGDKLQFNHPPQTGFYVPASGAGLCGTMLVSPNYGVIGFHVAGCPDKGFSATPTVAIAKEIRKILDIDVEAPFDCDDSIKPGVSGVRMRYGPDDVKVSTTLSETSYVRSIFHAEYNNDIKQLCAELPASDLTPVLVDAIDSKSPPDFKCKGSPATLIKEISKKTLKHQGYILEKERVFIADCIDQMIPEFTDIEDMECAFGGEYCQPLNKDSSNGYGCLSDKSAYFDFENKIIKESAIEMFAKFKKDAEEGIFDYKEFLSRETFKDELRVSTKKDTPRTFRVMPLPHIWWTKKIFAQLMPHFRKHMFDYGVCVGLNPYLHFDRIAKDMLGGTVTADADFSKWDGSLMEMMMQIIKKCLLKKYRGTNTKVIDYLWVTMSRTWVLVSDEVWATTHGLPSGTWLTLLLNCLVNKGLTALTLYRNYPHATTDDFLDIKDYVVGDDKLFSVPKKLAPYFNLLTVAETARSMGMDCTNGDKTPVTKPSQEFGKLSFVKRHFRQHPILKRYVGVLSIDTIMNTLQWVDATKDIDEAMAGKMRSVQVEAYLHSPALYQRLTTIMEKYYPFVALLDERRVIRILNDEEGYKQVLSMAAKDPSFVSMF